MIWFAVISLFVLGLVLAYSKLVPSWVGAPFIIIALVLIWINHFTDLLKETGSWRKATIYFLIFIIFSAIGYFIVGLLR
ncbi:hypothetical protein HYT17_03805 [Candidatus Microgenomates bacterium]|nr:hypothetical protein [Candidatus Microgenomates bacterium]